MILPVEIKVNVDGKVSDALTALGITQGGAGSQKRLIWFAERREGVKAGQLPLLEAGVILRVRTGDTPDDLTVKLRPVDPAKLHNPFDQAFKDGEGDEEFEYKIEEDRAGDRRTPAASATQNHPQSALLDVVDSSPDLSTALVKQQRKFLSECAPGVRFDRLVALGPIASTKFKDVALDDLEVDLERWQVVGLDFLEVSIRVKPKDNEKPEEFEARVTRKQQKLEAAVTAHGVAVSANPENKTRRVLEALAAGRA
ncbi:hypothetical protein [Kitasatospora sp. NPDC093806]|uniref:hypothetical protein n=1 Tax=Kitasatospora sp. NPDC093806 TaxID=3155075 RepID=UPI003446043C